ncbi:MAG: putative Ig domain-containing protein, partial [Polyangia bacterium]
MRIIVLRSFILGALATSACSTPDPCAGKSGTCISAHVDGNAHDLSQTRVTLPDGRVTTTQASSGSIKLPAQFAILIADNVPASPFAVQIDGIRGGAAVASDTENVTLVGGRGSVKFTLNEAGGGAGGGGGGGGSDVDMAVMNPPVVSGNDPVTIDELAALTVTLIATDPLGSPVTLSAASLPGNAMFDAGTGKLTWTPSYTDAGNYTVKITATPTDDATRAATYDLPITVKNAADPILIAGTPVLTAVPIGDWDKDGFGDLATCTGDAAGATGKYHFQILYGSATGLPLDAASGAGRVDSFDIAGATLGGMLYSCKGGDFDGDGHADIIFAD